MEKAVGKRMFPAAFFFSMDTAQRAASSPFLLYRMALWRVSAARTLEIPITTVTTVKTMDFKMAFFKFIVSLLPCAAHARGVFPIRSCSYTILQ